jgi:hypothetical protein
MLDPTLTEHEHEPTRGEAPPAITDAPPPFDGSSPWGADVILRSSDNVDFRVLKAPLAHSSPVFRDMFTLPRGHQLGQEGRSTVDEMRDGLPIVALPESGTVLYRLLHVCYRDCAATETAASKMDTLEDVFEVLKPATKYEMDAVERRVREELTAPRFLEAEPLRVFALAMLHGLEGEARAAAVMSLRMPLRVNLYVPELESLTAGDMLRLQEYHAQCAAAVQKIAKNDDWIERHWICFKCGPCLLARLGSKRGSTRGWWDEYMRQAAEELANCLAGATVLGEKLVNRALDEASRCEGCGRLARPEMQKFVQLFAAKIDQTISEVWTIIHKS